MSELRNIRRPISQRTEQQNGQDGQSGQPGSLSDLIGLGDQPSEAQDGQRAEIPMDRRGDWRARAILARERGAVAEQFRQTAVRLRSRLNSEGHRTLALTSAGRADGKTTVVCNLALAMSSLGAGDRIALLELDLRRPRVGKGLGVQTEVGIESVLAGEAPLGAARLRTQFETLDLFIARHSEQRAHELLSGPLASSVIQTLAANYRYVMVDTPPVLLVPDTPLLLPAIDACLFIVRRGSTRLRVLSGALDLLPENSLTGIFINEMAAPVRSREYGYYAKP